MIKHAQKHHCDSCLALFVIRLIEKERRKVSKSNKLTDTFATFSLHLSVHAHLAGFAVS